MTRKSWVALDRTVQKRFGFVLSLLLLCLLCTCGDFTLWGDNQGTSNSAPTASADVAPTSTLACEQTVVLLDGRGSSDPDGDTLTYLWSLDKPTGSSAAPFSTSAEQTFFTPDLPGDYTVTLTVSDGTDSDTDEATVTAGSQPIAVAAMGENEHICTSQAVNLDGTGSMNPEESCENTNLQYTWTLDTNNLPDGSENAVLNNDDTASPTLVPDVVGDYTVELQVDANQESDTDTVVVSVVPIADAGADQQGVQGEPVLLNGEGSLNPMTCDTSQGLTWEITTFPGDTAPTLSDPNAVDPVFTPDDVGTYVVKLTVEAGGLTDEDEVTVTVPVALETLQNGEYTITLGTVTDTVFDGILETYFADIPADSVLAQTLYVPSLAEVEAEPGGYQESYPIEYELTPGNVTNFGTLELTIQRSGDDEFYTVTGTASLTIASCNITVAGFDSGTIVPSTPTYVDISLALSSVSTSGISCAVLGLNDPAAGGTIVMTFSGSLME